MIDLTKLDKFYIDDFVKDIFIGMLQQLFYQNPSEFHWDPDPELSKLNVTDQFSYDNLTPDFKPTIYIRRRPLGFLNTSIDQFMAQSFNASKKVYSDLISGIVELVAVSREGLEACRLGGIVFLLINEFTGEFRKLGMHDISVKSLGEEEPKDVKTTMRVVEVPVTVQFVFQYTWMMQTMGLTPLGEISTGRSTDAATGQPLTGAVASPCNPAGGVAMSEPGTLCADGADADGCNPTCIQDDTGANICVPMGVTSPPQPTNIRGDSESDTI